MTVIVWDGKTLAADKQTSMGGGRFTVTKLHRHEGAIFGSAGDASMCREMADWIKRGRIASEIPVRFKEGIASTLLIEPDGLVLFYDNNALPTIIEDEFFAIGSGMEYALGAMFAGADAERGVAAAIRWSNSCGCGVDTLELETQKLRVA